MTYEAEKEYGAIFPLTGIRHDQLEIIRDFEGSTEQEKLLAKALLRIERKIKPKFESSYPRGSDPYNLEKELYEALVGD